MRPASPSSPSPFSARSSRPRRRLRHPARPDKLRGFELRPNEVPTHTFSRTPAFAWSPVRGAVLLRVRARDESLVRRELGLLVERRGRRRIGQVLPCGDDHRSCLRRPEVRQRRHGARADHDEDRAHPHSGDVGQPRPAVVHRQAVRALRPRPRRHDAWRDRVEQAVRVQHALGVDTGTDGVEARPRSLGARRGRDRVRRLVPGHPQGHSDAHERGRPARALQLPPRGQLVAARSLARPPGAAGRRRPPQRPACSLLRAMEPDLRDDEPGLGEPGSCSCAQQCRTR